MRMMVDSGKSFTRTELVRAIEDRFGAEARFHTCAADQLTAHELVDFLEQRGKFVRSNAGLGMAPESICDHE